MNILMFTNVIVRLIKICLDLISLLLNTVPYEYLSKAFSLHPQSWYAGKSSHVPINLLVSISKSNVSFDVDNIIFFHQFTTFSFSFSLFICHEKYKRKNKRKRTESYYSNSHGCLLYTSPSPRDLSTSRMPSSA